ncbi:hypothetical protein ACJMK2_019262 [Sinanodonta woodiana]|uniref:CUB domain-containing protein n=1 Tax=Sinanodonta woodiana TaxID=1069815 RepID=A0ABD3UFU1_SINWO
MLFPPASPLSPLAFTGVVGAVQGIAILSILSVIIQEIVNKRKLRTCGEPPSKIGDFDLVGKHGDAAFYDCPGNKIFRHDITKTCPIIYCQDDGNYSTPVFEPDISICFPPAVRNEVFQSTSGEIKSLNYPSNYTPSPTSVVWNIMVPGKKIKFKIEDLDFDDTTEIQFLCGLGLVIWTYESAVTVIGLEFTCPKPCALIAFIQANGYGGRGFRISYTTEE